MMCAKPVIEMAKEAFASRHAVDAWFKDAAPNFEYFAEMVRKEEREACAVAVEAERLEGPTDNEGDQAYDAAIAHAANAIRTRSTK